MTEQHAYVTVKIDEEGSIKIDTNLSALGAIHLMSNGTQLIIEKFIEGKAEQEKEA